MTKKSNNTNPAVEVAKDKELSSGREVIVDLTGGVRARLVPVPASLIDEVTSRIVEPEIPMWHNPDKERDEPNPSDPKYLKEVADITRKRGLAAIDAFALFGVELIDGMPEDDGWLKKLRYMEKRGLIDLSPFDLDDPLDKEFVYKRYVAVDATVLSKVSRLSGISQDEVTAAERSFRRQETR